MSCRAENLWDRVEQLPERQQTIIQTLAIINGWDPEDRNLSQLIQEVAAWNPDRMCPMCQEITHDEDCPLGPIDPDNWGGTMNLVRDEETE